MCTITLHQCLIFWKEQEDEAKIVQADKRPLSLKSHVAEARFYDFDMAPLKFWGIDKHGRPKRVAPTICGGNHDYMQTNNVV